MMTMCSWMGGKSRRSKMGKVSGSLPKGHASGSPRRRMHSGCDGLGTIHNRGAHLLGQTTGALTQIQEEGKRDQGGQNKAREHLKEGHHKGAVTGRYSTNAVATPAEMVGKGDGRLGASLMGTVHRGPRNRGTRVPDGPMERESLALWSIVAQPEKGLRSAALLTELLALAMLAATVRAPNVRQGAHGAWRETESKTNDLPTRPLSRATGGQWSALALRHNDGARMGAGASNGTSQSWCRARETKGP